MTMHLVRGMSSLNTKKRKVKKQPGWQKAKTQWLQYSKLYRITSVTPNVGQDMWLHGQEISS